MPKIKYSRTPWFHPFRMKCHAAKILQNTPEKTNTFGMRPFDKNIEPAPKRPYIKNCLNHLELEEVLSIAKDVMSEYEEKHIRPVLENNKNQRGNIKQIVFASNGPKPDFTLNPLSTKEKSYFLKPIMMNFILY
jgi:hypothetical protein